MKTIVFFNNKGGVGKTTLSCHIASFMSINYGQKVLFIDADPQCNATQLICSDDLCESIYSLGATTRTTLLDSLRLIEAGDSGIYADIDPIPKDENSFEVDLIAGHPRLSVFEDRLSMAWNSHTNGELGGTRITNWLGTLIGHFKDNYSIAVVDIGPSLGALNRSVILACDYFITPLGCDIFSLIGIKNIAEWIASWTDDYENGIVRLKKKTDWEMISKYPVIYDTAHKYNWAGYSIQQYVTKVFKEGRRPVKAYDTIMKEIPETITEALKFLTADEINRNNLELAHVPYLYSLVPLSQSAHKPIFALKKADGIGGSQFNQASEYSKIMENVCNKIFINIGLRL